MSTLNRTSIIRKVIDAGSMTGTSVITGKAIRLDGRSVISCQATWTGAAVGTFNFHITDHPCPWLDALGRPTPVETGTANTDAAWAVLTNPAAFSSLQPNNNAATLGLGTEFGFADVGGAFFRPVYTNSSSTGTTNVRVSAR